jgi:AcrR family transcriptional regulator
MADKKTKRDSLPVARLPHGPHRLTREQVVAHQRRRLMYAMTAVVGEKGYNATTVAEVVARAGVSRRAFYQCFPNKQACFLATYDMIVEEVLDSVTNAYSGAEDLADSASFGIQALFERSAADPNVLRLIMIEIGAAGPTGAARREQLIAAYEQRLRDVLGLTPGPGMIPNPILRAVVGGLNSILYVRAQSGTHNQLRELVPELVAWITSYYPAPASIVTLKDSPPRQPRSGLVGGRAPGTLAAISRTGRRRGLARRNANRSRSFVVHSQRERILDAVANLCAASGYAALTVDDIAQEAAVSLKAFYEHFADKEDAFLVAYEAGYGKGLAIVEAAYEAAPGWRAGVAAGISALFEFLASEPAFAHLVLIDAQFATPQTADRSDRGTTPFAQMLVPGLEETSAQTPPPPVAIEAIAGGIFELCFSYAVGGRIAELPELTPRATYFALAPFIGAEEAGRIATTGLAEP